MPVYEYKSLDVKGKKIKGIVDADSRAEVRKIIRQAGNYPVDIKETSSNRNKQESRKIGSYNFLQRVRQQEIYVITRQLATLLGAGVPLVSAFSTLVEQTTNQSLKRIIAQIKDTVNEGNSLTKALGNHPRLFSNVYVNMVHAGETTGSLDVVLDRLAEFGENQQALISRVKGALMYPIFMAFVGIVVLFILITFIVPNITKVFEDTHHALPLPTILLINVSIFLQNYWWLVVFTAAAAIIGVRFFLTKPKGRHFWDQLKLTLPLFKTLNRQIIIVRFGRTLGSLLKSGVPLITSLQIVKNILNNVLLAEVIDEATEELEKGQSLSHILRQCEWFPHLLVQMISVGEQSGKLEDMLEKVANSAEREVEMKVMAMTSLIEPVMILFMGLIVGFIVISILLPIFEMNQLIR